MRCELDKRRIHLLHDNLLDELEANSLLKHLDECKTCNEEISFLKSIKNQFARVEKVPVDPNLILRLYKIPKNQFKISNLLFDILKIIFRSRHPFFQINKTIEKRLIGKYPAVVIRWVFYC